jgi:hypothetical protein
MYPATFIYRIGAEFSLETVIKSGYSNQNSLQTGADAYYNIGDGIAVLVGLTGRWEQGGGIKPILCGIICRVGINTNATASLDVNGTEHFQLNLVWEVIYR